MVKDIRTDAPLPMNPNQFCKVGNRLYFTGRDATHGTELWTSDGTAAGTRMVKDITPSGDSSIGHLTALGDTLYFLAANTLWKTDGTEAGTVTVQDENATPKISGINIMTVMDGVLYFIAGAQIVQTPSSLNAPRLWKSDGTSNGTTVVTTLTPYPMGSGSFSTTGQFLIASNSILYYYSTVNSAPAPGPILWRSDGTAAGTFMARQMALSYSGEGEMHVVPHANGIYFGGYDVTYGTELWSSDGTVAGTKLVKDIWSGASGSSFPRYLTELNGVYYFQATAVSAYGPNGHLWKTDGTEAGTTVLRPLSAPPTSVSPPHSLIAYNNQLYFMADYGGRLGPRGLFKTDGTNAGTVHVATVPLASSVVTERTIVEMGGIMYFYAGGLSGNGLWRSDGTTAGTYEVRSATVNGVTCVPQKLMVVGDTLYIRSYNGEGEYDLWKSDGTLAGTQPVRDTTVPLNAGSAPTELVAHGGTLYFQANDGVHGKELWKSDGTEAGTMMVKDIATGASSSAPYSLTPMGEAVYFGARTETGAYTFWKSDGTNTGTTLVKNVGISDLTPSQLARSGNTLFFCNLIGTANLWTSDGTPEGTVLRSGAVGAPRYITPVNGGSAYFFGGGEYNPSDIKLWKSDGTEGGTVVIKDFYPDYETNQLGVIAPLGTRLLMGVNGLSGGSNIRRLWVSDGSEAGTMELSTINIDVQSLVTAGNYVYFVSDYGAPGGKEIWRTDGTQAGTVLVKDLQPGGNGSSEPANLTAAGPYLYFTASIPNSNSLWRTDGTEAGTVMIKSNFAPFSAELKNFAAVGSGVYFQVNDRVHGHELWHSDGTEAGTVMAGDLTGDSGGSFPAKFKVAGSQVFFTAATEATGEELWKIQLQPPTMGTASHLPPTASTAAVTAGFDAQGVTGHAFVEYGLTNSYGTRVPLTVAGPVTDWNEPQTGAATLRDLTPGATHHYRVVVYTAEGMAVSANQTFSTQTAGSRYAAWVGTTGLSGGDSGAEATPHADGVTNLLKYALNLNADGVDAHLHVVGSGTSGLPAIAPATSGGNSPTLRFEFVRRLGSGLVYRPQKSSDLTAGNWQPLTSTPVITPINAEWERVVYEEPYDAATTPRQFGRLQVTLP